MKYKIWDIFLRKFCSFNNDIFSSLNELRIRMTKMDDKLAKLQVTLVKLAKLQVTLVRNV